MSAFINVFINDATEKRLKFISKDTGRAPEILAELATGETALAYFKYRKDDPAKEPAP